MTVFPYLSEVTMQVWSESIHRFRRYSASNRPMPTTRPMPMPMPTKTGSAPKTICPPPLQWHNDNTDDICMYNDLMIGRPGYSCRGVATGWDQGSDCLSGQIECLENVLLIITHLQLMLESLNGMIFQRHYPYHTVAPW